MTVSSIWKQWAKSINENHVHFPQRASGSWIRIAYGTAYSIGGLQDKLFQITLCQQRRAFIYNLDELWPLLHCFSFSAIQAGSSNPSFCWPLEELFVGLQNPNVIVLCSSLLRSPRLGEMKHQCFVLHSEIKSHRESLRDPFHLRNIRT